ncbi:DUF6750 family protein [Escherichia coli]|uniref:DUF6750 family protein n=1 Tax=Escherichia coli TaxID=562 RepID=UPI001FB229E3|nr:DUF6750 family protein [Escherichia coli]EFU0742477.1 hypothetical protein [Escherichia coli]EHC4242333.1 hypothetical protein [Escherichia coli]EIV7776363.1 hypothetical protein [Escherichia coli]EIY9674165.1 hypothetical protein [Escherichia coli]MCJ1121980.1 hypothetical protein [Escherichia coli]
MNNVKNMFLRVSVRLYMLMLKLHELKRKALLVTLTFLTGGLFSQPALAAGDDVAGMINGLLGFFPGIKDGVKAVAMPLGLCFVIAGFIMMASKKNNPQITNGRIALIFIIGLCLIGLDQLISRGQKQMNLNPVGV